MVELPERIDRDEADGGAFLAPWNGPLVRLDVIAKMVQSPVRSYNGARQRRTVQPTLAGFDTTGADLCGFVRCEDGFGGQIEGLTEIQKNID
jgi:hypothetical protein